MTDQLALRLDVPIRGASRHSDPISSVVAARTVDAEHQRGKILAALCDAGFPLYAAEIARLTAIPTAQVSSRLAVMARMDLVRRLDAMGENDRGQPVLLWVPSGRPVLDVRTELV